jgi:hypothetical protein
LARRRHRLDLLPLLDVFMVVLFVFATMQEHELDVSTERRQQLRDELDVAQQQLGVAQSKLATAQATTITEATAAAEQARAEAEQAQQRARQTSEALQALRTETEAALESFAPGEDAVRQHEVYRRLLDHFTVYEIEIHGVGGDDAVVNRCCYRVDVQSDTWRSCGEVPAAQAQRQGWLDDTGRGLVEALRRTKGGNALTIVRQDEVATYRIASKLGELLRQRFDDHEIYAGMTAPGAVDCTGGP